MAEITGPRYDVNLAEVGKPEELPDIGAAMTQAFQRATNLVETSWFNQYQYQLAQYNLQDSAAKLQGLNIENDLNRQAYQQKADSFPLEQKARQQGLDLNQINLDQQKYNVAQRDTANSDLKAFQTELNDLNQDDPDYINKLNGIISKHTLAASNPYTQPQFNTLVNGKNSTYQSSVNQQVRNQYLQKLLPMMVPGNPGYGLLPHGINLQTASVNDMAQMYQQAQQGETTSRLRAIIARAQETGNTADVIKYSRMLNDVNAPPGGISHFDQAGELDQTMKDQIANGERQYKLSQGPLAGKMKKIKLVTAYDAEGKPLNTVEFEVPEDEDTDLALARYASVPKAPAPYTYDYNVDPDYLAAKQTVGDPKQFSADDYDKKVRAEYQRLRIARGMEAVPTEKEKDYQYFYRSNPQTQAQRELPPTVTTNPQNVVPPTVPTVKQPGAKPGSVPGVVPTQVQPGGRTVPGAVPSRVRGHAYLFPDEMLKNAPEGSWMKAWNDTVGQLVGNQNLESGNLPQFASTESGEEEYYQAYGQGRDTGGETAPVGNYGVADAGGNPALRALAYGPRSEGATAADMRQIKGAFVDRLQAGDIAISPNLLSRYKPLSRVDIVGPDGKVVMRNARVADTSWYSEGRPTTNTFEIYNGPSLGAGYHLVPAREGETAQR